MLKFLIVIIFLLSAESLLGNRLFGTLRDANNNPIPYASIYVKNTTNGVATDFLGKYALELPQGTYSIVFSSVGFQDSTVVIELNQANQKLDFTLKRSAVILNEVNVVADGKDPAYAIIKKAIKSRKNNTELISYKCNAYVKSTLENEFFIHDTISDEKQKDSIENVLTKEKVNIYESYGMVYVSGNKFKEVKQAVNDISNKYKSDFKPSAKGNGIYIEYEEESFAIRESVNKNLFKTQLNSNKFNFYKDLLHLRDITSIPYTSPIASTAFLNYKYVLKETFQENGKWINKIEIIPKRKNDALFSGYIYIEEDTWRLKSVDLELNKQPLNFHDYFRVHQNYSYPNDTNWVIENEAFYYDSKSEKKAILGKTIIEYTNYEIHPEFSKKFFSNEIGSVEDDAYNKGIEYWQRMRPITLDEKEIDFIEKQDSIITYYNSYEYLSKQDSIKNKQKLGEVLFGMVWVNTFKKQSFYVKGLVWQQGILGIGGYRYSPGVGGKKEFENGIEIETDVNLNYGFRNNDLKGVVSGAIVYAPKRRGKFHFSLRDNYAMLNRNEGFEGLFSRGNYVNDQFLSIGNQVEIVNGLYGDVQFELGRKSSISDIKLSRWSEYLFEELNRPVAFDAYNEFLTQIKLKYRIRQQYILKPHKKQILPQIYPELELTYRKALPNFFNSTIDFDYLEFGFSDDIQVLTLGTSKVRAAMGSFLTSKNLRITDYKYFRRSDLGWFSNPLTSLNLLRTDSSGGIFTTKPFMQLNAMHSFNGVLWNKIPFFNRIEVLESFGMGSLITQEQSFKHVEAFIGLELPFRFQGQRMKFGMYYVTAINSQTGTSDLFKIGIDYFNSYTNKWTY